MSGLQQTPMLEPATVFLRCHAARAFMGSCYSCEECCYVVEYSYMDVPVSPGQTAIKGYGVAATNSKAGDQSRRGTGWPTTIDSLVQKPTARTSLSSQRYTQGKVPSSHYGFFMTQRRDPWKKNAAKINPFACPNSSNLPTMSLEKIASSVHIMPTADEMEEINYRNCRMLGCSCNSSGLARTCKGKKSTPSNIEKPAITYSAIVKYQDLLSTTTLPPSQISPISFGTPRRNFTPRTAVEDSHDAEVSTNWRKLSEKNESHGIRYTPITMVENSNDCEVSTTQRRLSEKPAQTEREVQRKKKTRKPQSKMHLIV